MNSSEIICIPFHPSSKPDFHIRNKFNLFRKKICQLHPQGLGPPGPPCGGGGGGLGPGGCDKDWPLPLPIMSAHCVKVVVHPLSFFSLLLLGRALITSRHLGHLGHAVPRDTLPVVAGSFMQRTVLNSAEASPPDCLEAI